jgi:hypothetical protein
VRKYFIQEIHREKERRRERERVRLNDGESAMKCIIILILSSLKLFFSPTEIHRRTYEKCYVQIKHTVCMNSYVFVLDTAQHITENKNKEWLWEGRITEREKIQFSIYAFHNITLCCYHFCYSYVYFSFSLSHILILSNFFFCAGFRSDGGRVNEGYLIPN